MFKKTLKTTITLFIVIVTILNLSVPAFAQNSDNVYEAGSIGSFSHESETYFSSYDDNPDNYSMDDREIVDILRSSLSECDAQVTVKYASHTMHNIETLKALIDSWFESSFNETDKSNQGDYLRYNYAGYVTDTINYWKDNGVIYYIIPFTLKYYANKEQEEILASKIQEVINSFGFDKNTTDKEKCDAIYDYITSNVTYDYNSMEDPEYMLKFSAYAALINKTAVCQGYASLFYRMARECGLKVRNVSGRSQGQRHVWNIVKIGGYYYYLDATWDSSEKEHQYYLKGSTDFIGHTPDSEFLSNSFMRDYPISKSSYVDGGLNEGCQMGHLYELYYEDNIEMKYTCLKCGDIKSESKLPMGETLVKSVDGNWYYYVDGVASKATTLVKYSGKWFYICDGVWKRDANVLFKYKGKWFYIEKGKWNSKANLFFQIDDKLFYVKGGKWSSSLTTLVKYDGKWLYIKNGKWSTEVAIVGYNGKQFFVNAGYARLNYSGRVIIGGKFYKIKNGKVVK